jgi:type II secretory pathway component PulF
MSIGLRAAAAESPNRRIKQALEQLARGTDLGQSLEDVLNANSGSFPPHVAGLIAAATRTAQLGGALEELLEHQRQMRDIRGTVISAITYPLLVIGLATIVFLLLMLDIVPIFGKMFEEFELELPAATMSLIQVSDACVAMTLGEQKWLLLGVGTTTIVTLLLIRFVAGSAGWRRFLGTAPLFGPIVTWSGAAAFAQMMGVLLDYDIPLPRALELTSDAVRDGNVREACRRLVDGITDGQTLTNVLEEGGYLPETLVPFVRSGEQHGDLAGALKLASQVFVERIGLRASLISSISPPVIFVFVALGIAFSVIALFMPLLAIIVGLS